MEKPMMTFLGPISQSRFKTQTYEAISNLQSLKNFGVVNKVED